MVHNYFVQVSGSTPNSRCRAIVAHVLNSYLGKNFSVTKWRKVRPFPMEWGHQEERRRVTIDYNDLVDVLHEYRRIDVTALGLPPLMSPLFDSPVEIGLPQAIVGSDGDTVKISLPLEMGTAFPLSPTIDREGFAIADMQGLVEQNIAALYRQLLATSHLAPQPRSGWLFQFRQLVMESVTAVDMMLHKVHLLAEYRGKELGWSYDAAKMGPRHSARLADKFRWVSYVSNRPFALSPSVKKSFWELKKLRNHLVHFDPPCFAATLAEVASWLNCIKDVGEILWSVRTHLAQQLSQSTIEVLMLPQVRFNSVSTFNRDVPPHDDAIGYRSATWGTDGQT